MSIFSKIQARKPGYNTFDLSHDRKFTTSFGEIIPIHVMECVPGDRISMSTSQMLRFAPLVAPVMHQVNVYTHFFFVPNRLLWGNWEKFITGGEDGLDASVFPTVEDTFALRSLGDYLGLPTETTGDIQVSALPFAAYQLVYQDYFRDQNLQPESGQATIPLVDGDNTANAPLFFLRQRAWQHDYFTAALPWTQKGPEATIPLGTSADINFSPSVFGDTVWNVIQNSPATGPLDIEVNATTGIPEGGLRIDVGGGVRDAATIDNTDSLSVDLSTATAATINELRRAFKLQEWLEKNARGGSRYIESILSHFGVKSSDARLQRPEFLGGGSNPVQISEVLQTSGTNLEPTPQGNMAGHGISVGKNNGFSYFCEEHGYIIGVMSVMPRSAYQQGIPKHFLKWDKFDYYWPSFAHLGEQPILNKELYADPLDGEDEDVFGYTPRYAEYKYLPNTVHGDFRTFLDFWHMGRIFSARPALNSAFVRMQATEVGRIFAVQDAETYQLYCHVFHKIKARRPMPYFGTPTI